MTRLPVGTEIEADHPPHGGKWERLPGGKLRLLEATYPQAETPAEAAHRAAQESPAPLAARPDEVLTESDAEAAARPRASRKKEG